MGFTSLSLRLFALHFLLEKSSRFEQRKFEKSAGRKKYRQTPGLILVSTDFLAVSAEFLHLISEGTLRASKHLGNLTV